jgi:hypothetical protein
MSDPQPTPDPAPDLFTITPPEMKMLRMTADGTVLVDWPLVEFMAARPQETVETHFARWLMDVSNGLVKRP